jgi:glycosyltransferase involved in cell wall biosynthesis
MGIIVGGPLFGEEAYAAELVRKVDALGLADRIRFLGFRSDIPVLMRSMDVVVHSSIAPEPFGRVVVEAMLAGRPVVASAAGGVLEIIEDGSTGWLYEPGSADALAKALRLVLDDNERAMSVAAFGQTHARENFTVAAAIRQVDVALQLI